MGIELKNFEVVTLTCRIEAGFGEVASMKWNDLLKSLDDAL